MSQPINLKEKPPLLKLTAESPHFKIHYGLRNPPWGKGLGADGVRDQKLIRTYLEALEKLYKTLTSTPWKRRPPGTDKKGKTHVYVFNSILGAFTMFDPKKGPFIVLPSRNCEPTPQAELFRAASEAVHEATHAFTHSERPHRDLNSAPWKWFDEGFAVYMEMLVQPRNPDYFRFLMDWIDSPHIPLDDPGCHYQAGMFISYLVKRLGAKFVNDVWMGSRPSETPLEALERLIPDGSKFFSSDHLIRDVFASGYCIDPYCLWDHASKIFLRYGERGVSESLHLPKHRNRKLRGTVDHLACRYYRFYLDSEVSNFSIKLRLLDDPYPKSPIKGEVAIVSRDGRRSAIRALAPQSTRNGRTATLVCSLQDLQADDIDHLVLVVSNSGTRAGDKGKVKSHDDGKSYVIITGGS